MTIPDFTTLEIRISQRIGVLTLNRPDRSNAFNDRMWKEFVEVCHPLNSEDIHFTARASEVSGYSCCCPHQAC
jgi:enoyl-CoA hydratase/carnithine racemase